MKKRSFTQNSTWQILFGDAIVPRCVPVTYRVYLLLKKLQRSCAKRRRKGPVEVPAQSPPQEVFTKEVCLGKKRGPVINRTVMSIDEDMRQPEVAAVIEDLGRLKAHMETKGVKATSAAGSFKKKDFVALKEKNKLWENAWLLAHMPISTGEAILDVGGASTLLSFYLLWKGARVAVVDNDWGLHGLIYNARHVARVLKWPLEVHNRDLSQPLPFPDNAFDKVFCVCVLEHLTSVIRRQTMAEISRVLKPGGVCGLTIDYDLGRRDPGFDKGLRFGLPRQLQDDLLTPSGLSVWGNQTLTDDCPPDFFLGTLFLKKDQ